MQRKPRITEQVVGRVQRAATRNTMAAELAVKVCTLMPYGAPPTYQGAKYVALTLSNARETTIAIRQVELDRIIDALQEARMVLGVALPERPVTRPEQGDASDVGRSGDGAGR